MSLRTAFQSVASGVFGGRKRGLGSYEYHAPGPDGILWHAEVVDRAGNPVGIEVPGGPWPLVEQAAAAADRFRAKVPGILTEVSGHRPGPPPTVQRGGRGLRGLSAWSPGHFESGAHTHQGNEIVLVGKSTRRLYDWAKPLSRRLKKQLASGAIDRETAAFEFYPWVKAAAREAKIRNPKHDVLMDAANVMASYL